MLVVSIGSLAFFYEIRRQEERKGLEFYEALYWICVVLTLLGALGTIAPILFGGTPSALVLGLLLASPICLIFITAPRIIGKMFRR